MLTDKDVAKLFAVMKSAYGSRWTQAPDAMQVWLRMLGGFKLRDVMTAAKRSIEQHPEFPPTLGQFAKMVELPPRPNTFLPGPTIEDHQRWANRAMMHVLMKNNGTDKATLKQMIALKNALCEDFVNGNVEVDTFSKQVARELTAILP